VVVVEVENEEYNEPSAERGRRRDSEAGAASESKKTNLALDMLVYERGGERDRLSLRNQATGSKQRTEPMYLRRYGVSSSRNHHNKDSAVLCIAGSRGLARDDFKVGAGSVTEYMVGRLLQTRSVCFYGADGESSESTVLGGGRGEGGVQAVNVGGRAGGRSRRTRTGGKMKTKRESGRV